MEVSQQIVVNFLHFIIMMQKQKVYATIPFSTK